MKLIKIANIVRYMNHEQLSIYDSLKEEHSACGLQFRNILNKENYDPNNITWVNRYEEIKTKFQEIDKKLQEFKAQFIEKMEKDREKALMDVRKEERKEQKLLEKAKNDLSFQRKIERAVEDWPRTNNPNLAGYIMPDGGMLNLSSDGYTRGMDHRYITQDIDQLSGGTAGMVQFQYATGAVRMHTSGRYVSFDCLTPPTRSQKRTMIKVSEGKEITLHINDEDLEFDSSESMIEHMRWY